MVSADCLIAAMIAGILIPVMMLLMLMMMIAGDDGGGDYDTDRDADARGWVTDGDGAR